MFVEVRQGFPLHRRKRDGLETRGAEVKISISVFLIEEDLRMHLDYRAGDRRQGG